MLRSWYQAERQGGGRADAGELLRSRREFETFELLIRHLYPNTRNPVVRGVKREIITQPSVLDIGCGSRYLRHAFKDAGWKYEGIDYDTCNVEIDLLPYKCKSFDLVVSLALIEHLSDPSNLLNEARRVCKSDGFLIISTPNWNLCMDDFYDDPTHIHPYTPTGLKRLMRLAGFEDIRVIPNLRCKPVYMYMNRWSFRLAAMIPFRSDFMFARYLPEVLKGKSRGIFAICRIP